MRIHPILDHCINIINIINVYGLFRQVIQAMTVGSDVSSLFPDVVNCMQTNSLDLKRLGCSFSPKR